MSITPISARTTHDLWVESRRFTIDLTRPTPTTINLKITRPADLEVIDGALVLLSESPVTQSNYPVDGKQYVSSTDWIAPVPLGTAKIVGAFYETQAVPFPPDDVVVAPAVAVPGERTFSITVTNTNPAKVYYASVHGVTQVLQYYPIGVQSYPLSASFGEVLNGSTFTGNIPSLHQPPTNPPPGFVYHDIPLNLVQYYDASQGVWIPTRADSIVSGPYNPGTPGQTYLISAGQRLMVFDGAKWVKADTTNFRVLSTTGFVPMTRVTANIDLPQSPTVGDIFYSFTTQRAQYWDGVKWVWPNSTNTLLVVGASSIPAFITPLVVEPVEIAPPYVGQLFYNTTNKLLNAWSAGDGVTTFSGWNQVNTDQVGVPSTDKVSIGTDGSYDERASLITILKSQLGYPKLCVELDEAHFNIAIDNALDTYRQLSDGAYRTAYILYPLLANQQKYYLNSATDETDHIVDVVKIHRLNGYSGMSQPNNLFMGHLLVDHLNIVTAPDLLTVHMFHSLTEDLERLLAGNLTFNWYEARRELTILRQVGHNQKVILEALLERPEQEILVDRWCRQFIQNYALAEAKMALGLIRSKYSSGTPGAAGTITLNGELLIAEARQDMTELKQELLDYEFGGHVGHGNVSFLIG